MEQYSQENPLFELLYILRGGIPQQHFLFHHIFRYFDKDQKLAIKLCRKLMNYQDCNQKNPNGQTPLQIAVIYNQKGAIRYAQHECRFDFNDENLMQLAITNSYFEIVEILLFDEGLSVVESNQKKMNSQSSTNLKILKRYEKIEIQRILRDDTSEYQETIINEIPQFLLTKTPGKIMIENINESLIPTTQCIQTSEDICQEDISKIKQKNARLCSLNSCQENQIHKQENEIKKQQENRIPFQNLFRCQTYVEQLLSTIFQFKYSHSQIVQCYCFSSKTKMIVTIKIQIPQLNQCLYHHYLMKNNIQILIRQR